jgi:cell division protein FtsL
MDKINFAHAHSPYVELQLARWYTISCSLIVLMLIGMCSIYVMQWRTYQHAMHTQKSYSAQRSLEQEYAQLQTQQKEHNQRSTAQKTTCQQLAGLNEGLAQDITLQECVIARDGSHTLTLTAPSRQRAQACIALLNKKQLFGTLTLTSLKTVKNGQKSHLLVTLKANPATNS